MYTFVFNVIFGNRWGKITQARILFSFYASVVYGPSIIRVFHKTRNLSVFEKSWHLDQTEMYSNLGPSARVRGIPLPVIKDMLLLDSEERNQLGISDRALLFGWEEYTLSPLSITNRGTAVSLCMQRRAENTFLPVGWNTFPHIYLPLKLERLRRRDNCFFMPGIFIFILLKFKTKMWFLHERD